MFDRIIDEIQELSYEIPDFNCGERKKVYLFCLDYDWQPLFSNSLAGSKRLHQTTVGNFILL